MVSLDQFIEAGEPHPLLTVDEAARMIASVGPAPTPSLTSTSTRVARPACR